MQLRAVSFSYVSVVGWSTFYEVLSLAARPDEEGTTYHNTPLSIAGSLGFPRQISLRFRTTERAVKSTGDAEIYGTRSILYTSHCTFSLTTAFYVLLISLVCLVFISHIQ
jgi:hypothetical protein